MSETMSQLMVWPGLVVEVVLSPSSCTAMTAWCRAWSSWMVQLGLASTSHSISLRDWNWLDSEPEIWTGAESED